MTCINQYGPGSQERVKSTSPDLKVMHDQPNNSYHSSLYRHQAQTQQQNDRSAKTSITTFNENASCDSAAPPLKESCSLTPTGNASADAADAAAAPAQQTPTLSDYLYSTTTILHTTDENNYTSTSLDNNSLYDVMDSTSSIGSNAAHHHHTHETRDSLDTMLSYLCKYDDLAQHMDAMDQLETVPFLRVMHLGIASSEERRLILKNLSDGLSATFFHHTPSTLSPPLLATSTTPSDSKYINMAPHHPCGFREQKYHILPLDLSLANNDLLATMFDDTGVSIVEADFTVNNNKIASNSSIARQPNYHRDPELILHYVYTQCQQTHSPTMLQDVFHPPSHWDNQHFNGRIFSDEKSNGIDLCVYFYHDAQYITQLNKDMEVLWKISALGIPILPILPVSHQIPPPRSLSSSFLSPNSRLLSKIAITAPPPSSLNSQNFPFEDHGMTMEDDYKDDHSMYLQLRPIDVRRNELAYLFSRWRIKMMDISNLDIIGQPSFQTKGKAGWSSVNEDMVIKNLLGQAWASSSLISPTPYHVLTLYQFMAIDRWVISKLLMAIKDRSKDQRQHTDGDNNNELTTTTSNDQDSIITPASTSASSLASKTIITVQHPKEVVTSLTINHPSAFQPIKLEFMDLLHTPATFYIWIFLLLAIFSIYGLWIAWNGTPGGGGGGGGLLSLVIQSQQPSKTWRASFNMVSYQAGETTTFIVSVYDGYGQSTWAPDPPVLMTNIPFATITKSLSHLQHHQTTICYSETTKLNDSSDSLTLIVSPLPNKTYPHEVPDGHYFYLLPIPPCSALNPTIDYYVQVKPSAIFPSQPPGIVQGSPLRIPNDGFCGNDDSSTVTSNVIPSQTDSLQENFKIILAWRHIQRHTRFYILHSIKILELYWTAGA